MEYRVLIVSLIVFVLYGLTDWYYIQMLQTIFRRQWIYIVGEALSLFVLILFIYRQFSAHGNYNASRFENYGYGLLFAFVVFKIFLSAILILEDAGRVLYALYARFFSTENRLAWESRRKFVSQVAMGVAAIPFASLLYGVLRGRYQYQVISLQLFFEDLPPVFDGYKITQISDIHCGSFDNEDKVQAAIDLVNNQKSDVILFTGDVVNNRSEELSRWQSVFAQLKAPDGVFSILGNHDYGDYTSWASAEEKSKNFERLKDMQRAMGFDLLLNEHRYLQRGDQKIALIGVENWGAGFRQSGDLEAAKQGIAPEDFKILMSHDPTHWEHKVLKDTYHYHLTLSGHTHGMQFGVEIPGVIKWSPSQWRYKHWAGLYREKGQNLYVNRGLGYIGYPGRFGIWPEVTVIELKKGAAPEA